MLQAELGVQHAELRLHLHHGALVIGHEASVRSEVAFQHSGELIAAGQSRQHLVRQFLPLLVQHIQRALAQRALAVAQPHHCILEGPLRQPRHNRFLPRKNLPQGLRPRGRL